MVRGSAAKSGEIETRLDRWDSLGIAGWAGDQILDRERRVDTNGEFSGSDQRAILAPRCSDDSKR